MEGEGFGACLSRFIEHNPSQHVCQATHLAPVIGCDASQINRWLRGNGAPKLNSSYVSAIAQHLLLSAKQTQELEDAQIFTLKQPKQPRKKRITDPPSDIPSGTSSDTPPGGARKPPYFGARGKAVVENLLALLEEAPDGTGRNDPANTITLTWRSRRPLQMTDGQQIRWRVALQSVLQRGWRLHYLCLLDKNVYRTVDLVQNMLDFIDMGEYVPSYFKPGHETLTAATDLLVIPGFAAAWLYSAQAADRADAGIFVRDLPQVRAMMAHAGHLAQHTAPLITAPTVAEASGNLAEPVVAIRQAEDHSGGRRLFKNGLSLFTQPREWFEGVAAPPAGLAMTPEEWRIICDNQLQRIDAFKRNVQNDDYYDICPQSALKALIQDGIYPRDDIFFERTQQTHWRLEHLRNTVRVLEDNKRYQIGFIDDHEVAPPGSAASRRLDTMWQVTGDGSVFLATWIPGVSGQLMSATLHITQHAVTQGFSEYFERMWNMIPPEDRERGPVISRLKDEIARLERRVEQAGK
ncbi:MAG TPA: hypothetical protein VF739_12365 [Ktedonobacterales bacterium]